MTASIVPPYLLDRLAEAGDERFPRAAAAARACLRELPVVREARAGAPLALRATSPLLEGAAVAPAGPARSVHDADRREDLPGRLVRAEGQVPTGDDAVDEAYDGLGATYALLAEAFGRRSIDDAEHPLDATVHYGLDYDNAFWDGTRMVFGDGDGELFGRFTASLSVIGHELAHGVVQHTAGLVYQGQPGALNESISDVFGALVEQHAAGQTVQQASWLIGSGLFTEEVDGVALRSMRDPGTAYDDELLGRDPQPAHMRDYVDTQEDDGGVHLNSGIPNRAFVLTADRLGGYAWERAGLIWYDALIGGFVGSSTDFAAFAAATVAAATQRFGDDSEEATAVAEAWAAVGVEPA